MVPPGYRKNGSDSSLTGDIGRTLGHWMFAQVKIVAILIAIYSAGFALSGVPWWFAVGVVCGLLNFVPFVGAALSLLIVLPVAWFGTEDIVPVIGALITYVVAQGLEGFYLTPKIMGSRLSLSPWLVFVAILAGGLMFGPLGVLFAAPVVAIAAVVWRRMSRRPGSQTAPHANLH